MNIYDAVTSGQGFRPYFKKGLDSWASWLVFFKAISGKDMDEAEMALFRVCTGLDVVPNQPLKEIFLCCGRRSGKTTVCAIATIFYSIWGGWQEFLQAGEQPMVFIVSPNMQQGKIIMGYIRAILKMKNFRHLVKRELADSIELKNGVRIEIKPASWRSTRGWSCGLLVMEELAFWRFETESANPDTEVYTALKPSTVNIKNSMIFGCSTPFTRQGLLWQRSAAWGRPGPILFWRAPTWKMNLTLTEEGLRRDFLESLGEAEFNAEFGALEREDIEQYLPSALLDAAIVKGRSMVPEERGVEYVAFCDPAEGLRKGGDSMTFAIAHKTEEPIKYILDLLLEFRAPYDPKQVISQIVEAARPYHIMKIIQDRHAIGWIASDLKRFSIEVEPCEFDKSKIYEHFAVLMNKLQIELLDNERLRTQIMGLQKFLRGGGSITIDHLRGGHDDLVNAAAGACVAVSRQESVGAAIGVLYDVYPRDDEESDFGFEEWCRRRGY
jgi:hypothetical protein